MKPSTRLDSAVFQLTPTRTRCDLVISANGKTEKIASGLLNPFLLHLKAAQDQMDKGGYSIILEPEAGHKATWFTKATVERFVRFVSTPEVLERVYTLESEILQIEEAITIQSNNSTGLQTVEGHQAKPAEVMEAVKPVLGDNKDKAIVLYKLDSHLPEANGSTGHQGHSRVQLLKVLETRKTVLQKEQGMAFARAVAAGFDVELLTPLMSFAETFGASRLMDACTKFIELWKKKHENGQWVEIEGAESLSCHLDYANMNASGIMLSDMVNKQKVALPEPSNDMASEENGKASSAVNADDKSPMNPHVPPGYPEYFQGQFPQMFSLWPMHSPPGAPLGFQPYPMPYLQNYPNPYAQQATSPVEDPRLNSDQKVHQKQRHHKRRSSNTGLISSDVDGLHGGSSDLEQDGEFSLPESQKKGGRSNKKKGVVVIRNINYITRQKQNSSDSESNSDSEPKTDGVYESVEEAGTPEMKHRRSERSQERSQSSKNNNKKLTSSVKEELSYGNEPDGGNWHAFQSHLLKNADEGQLEGHQGTFSMEKEVWLKRRKNALNDDPLASDARNIDESPEGFSADMHRLSGSGALTRRTSNDGLLVPRKEGNGGSYIDVHYTELQGSSGYKRKDTDDFIIHRQGNSLNGPASDRFAMNGYEGGTNIADIRSSQDTGDDSYIVSFRSASTDEVGGGNRAIDIDSELPSAEQRKDKSSRKEQVNYEPDELSMMPERGMERGSSGFDPALDYEMQASASLDKSGKEVETYPKQRSKDSKRGQSADPSGKKNNVGPIRKGKPTKLSPLDEARARAEKLRSYKADLQKLKKEKEEEQMKRIEALKLERQKRIAARGSSIPAQSPQSSQKSKKQLPTATKLSPSSHKGSKFSDLVPGSSPLQRFSVRTASKPSRLTAGSSSVESRLTRSASSLPETKKEETAAPEKKASQARIRRLSEPKFTNNTFVTPVKPRSGSTKPKAPADADNKKISAILNLDRSKAATLPELKVKAAKAPDAAKSPIVKETTLKVNGTGSKPSISSHITGPKGNGDQNSQQTEDDNNPIIEKTVVMLECQKPAVSVTHSLEEKVKPADGGHNDCINGEGTFPNQSSARILVSPPTVGETNPKSRGYKVQEQIISSSKLGTHDEASAEVTSVRNDEKPYQVPYARVSSLEDPCTNKSEYGKAPTVCVDARATGLQSLKAHVADTSSIELEKSADLADKSSKDSTKGFKRLLKFGRKNTNSSERDSDNVSVGGSDTDDNASKPASSTEVHTLKNLISQDETPTAATTPKKSSRAFSLLSPFRSKNSEKKHAT